MKRIKLRLQDLTREQAYGVQGRLILRIFPLFKFKDEVTFYEIKDFYDKLFSLSHLLFDVALGNILLDEAVEQAKEHYMYFQLHSNKIVSKNRSSAQPILLTLDALSQLNQTTFFEKPGLATVDKGFGDLAMSIAMAGHAISMFGLENTVIDRSVENDCKFIFDNNKDPQCLDVDFFKQKLWSQKESILSEETGMSFALEHVILKEWKDSLLEKGLEGIFSSYESRIYGLNLKKKNQANTKTVINNVTITLGEGATFTGPVSVGENIKTSFNIANKMEKENLKRNLKELIQLVGKLIEEIPNEEEKKVVSEQLKSLVEEAEKDKPNSWLLGVSSEGILKASQAFVDLVSPISTIVKNVLSIL